MAMRKSLLLGAAAASVSIFFGTQSFAGASGVKTVARQGMARPWLHAGPVTVSAPLEHRARARAFLDALAPEAAKLQLVAVDVESFGDGDKIVRFEQTHLGLPVVGAGAAIRMNARGEHVMSSTALEASLPASATPTKSASDAAREAQRFTKIGVFAQDAHLVWLPTREGVKLAYAVVPLVPVGMATAPRIMVDAHTGKVLEARDLVQFLDKARVYETNPTKSPTLVDKDLPMSTVGGVLSNDFIISQNCIDKQSVKDVSFQGFPLKVHVCDLATKATADANGDFLYDPIDDGTNVESRRDAFSEVSMYYHASRAYQFFRGLQGDPTAQVVVDKPFRTVSNLQIAHGLFQGDIATAAKPDVPLDPMQNAFFSPAGGALGAVFTQLYGFSSGAMWFGQGPRRDYSYDGDVVYHEFTHAVVDKTLKLEAWHVDQFGIVDSPGAMNEGLADYFSSALTGDPDVGEYASQDIAPNMKVIRTLANQDACPGAIAGEVHQDSTLFSGGLWEARQTLPEADRAKYDASLYKAMRTNAGKGDLGYEDLTNLFLTALETDLPAGAAALEKAMTGRNVLPGCNRAIEYKGAPIKAPGGVGGFAAPGTANLNGGTTAPGIVQVTQALPARSKQITLTFTSRPATGQSPFGGGGTPFTPVVLVKFDKPVTWTTKGALAPDADATVDATGDNGKPLVKYTATVDVPEGVTSVYAQIGNKGESDGNYDSLELSVVVDPAPEQPAPPPNDPPAPAGSSDSSGCSVSSPAAPSTLPLGGFVLGGLGLAALVARRRNNRR
jgi:MYXO-CTERM domain-containing protein